MSRSFIVKLPNRQQDSKGTYKKELLEEVFKNRPYLSDDCTSCSSCPFKRNISYAGPGNGILFGGNTFNERHRCYSPYDLSYLADPSIPVYNAGTKVPVFDLYTQYEQAMNAINNYSFNKLLGFTPRKKLYDFTLNGQPVRIRQNHIQVGLDIIPIGYGSRDYFYSLPETKRVTITTIIIEIEQTLVGSSYPNFLGL